MSQSLNANSGSFTNIQEQSLLPSEVITIRTKLNRLRHCKDADFRALTGEQRKDFEDLNRYIMLLSGQQAYAELYNLIRECFHDQQTSHHGTVSQYFSGCINAQNKGDYCNPACIDGVKGPNNEACQKRVYSCLFNQEKGYLFFPKTEVQSREADLYMLEFRGFSKSELQYLRKQGLDKVHIYDYQANPYPGISTPQTLTQLEQKHLRPTVVTPSKPSDKSDSAMVFLVFLLVGLLFIFLLVAYASRTKSS